MTSRQESNATPKSGLWIAIAVAISVLSLAGLALDVAKIITFDTAALFLAGIALAPWLSVFLDNATLPGGWRLEFRRLQAQQHDQGSRLEQQRAELDTLKFLLQNLLTKHERGHLERLSSSAPFPYEWRKSFEMELTRLLALDLIDRQKPNKGIRSAAGDQRPNNNLHEHFFITEKGKDYLKRLKEMPEAEA